MLESNKATISELLTLKRKNFKYLVANATLLWIFVSYIGTVERLTRRDLYIQYIGWGLLVVLPARCGLAAWMHWSCIVFGFNSVEELYPSRSPLLGVDSADTSQLPRKKNLHGKFQYFQ
jgi:hypothetical protein